MKQETLTSIKRVEENIKEVIVKCKFYKKQKIKTEIKKLERMLPFVADKAMAYEVMRDIKKLERKLK